MPSSGCQTSALDRKSTRLNSSHTIISYAVFCLKKKHQQARTTITDETTAALDKLSNEHQPRRHVCPIHAVHIAPLWFSCLFLFVVFFFNDTATTEIYTLSLHDALPISDCAAGRARSWPGTHPAAGST